MRPQRGEANMPGREDGSLVDLIYDAALEPAQWESVIARMAALVGGTSGWLSQLNFIDGSGGHLHDPMAGVDTSWVPKYLEYFADRNPFATAADPQDYLAKWTTSCRARNWFEPNFSTTGCVRRTSHRP
jgi:hypothetical protein